MREEDIQRIQNELMNKIDSDVAREEWVVNLSKNIAGKLILSNKTTAEIDGEELAFMYTAYQDGDTKGIRMIVANITKYRLIQEKYIPFTVKAEVNNELTLRENLEAVVEAYLRHILDMVEADEIN